MTSYYRITSFFLSWSTYKAAHWHNTYKSTPRASTRMKPSTFLDKSLKDTPICEINKLCTATSNQITYSSKMTHKGVKKWQLLILAIARWRKCPISLNYITTSAHPNICRLKHTGKITIPKKAIFGPWVSSFTKCWSARPAITG